MLSPTDIELLRQKELAGELTLEDSMRFIEATRAAFLARPNPTTSKGPGKEPPKEMVDFF